ncbi:P-loop containing nucleoside triphosphate hydrolase protein [Sistotremastrum suecicum HHB10207 ss-3]|uniref:RNA helicase n=1 Tax=Sistotremastrum suecicum HHB10207 ss-3 TaxID=1314776 RepID=A0A166GGC6_9AGAM|nr:P-loop containing nucleoside triphosphate hydrolase protein [Sistotremastrum suecicum HHB10207 ss-3]
MDAWCKSFVETGKCKNQGCQKSHNLRFCSMCNIVRPNKEWAQHLNSTRHRQLATNPKDATSSRGPPSNTVFCPICHATIPARLWTEHQQTVKHKRRDKHPMGSPDQAEHDIDGVTVTKGPLDFGTIDASLNQAVPRQLTITIANDHDSSRISLLSASFASAGSSKPFSLVSSIGSGLLIVKGRNISLPLRFTPSTLGAFEDQLDLQFKNLATSFIFHITRPVRAVYVNKADYESFQSNAPYVKKPRRPRTNDAGVVPGIRPPYLNSEALVPGRKLPQAFIPQELSDAVEEALKNKSNFFKVASKFMPKVLSLRTYASYFQNLLHLEEEQSARDIEIYNMEDVTMTPKRSYYFLAVKGLLERRPSVIVGDRFIVTPSTGTRRFEGFVHITQRDGVLLKFHESFHAYKGAKYNIEFRLNRTVLRRMHQAVLSDNSPSRVLFPEPQDVIPAAPSLGTMTLVNRSIASDSSQLFAVNAIKNQPPGSPPFIVFGPPGTGKTVTIVEAMLQLVTSRTDVKILACAPSNSAADLITERLAAVLEPRELFRLNAPSRGFKELRERGNWSRFSRYCKTAKGTYKDPSIDDEGDHFICSPIEDLKKFRVVVTTCASACQPWIFGIDPGHFTHIFIDEAGQAMEPEIMIAVKLLTGPATNIVLSGDPKQLGPIVRSPIAKQFGLAKSFLNRLMERRVYTLHSGSEYEKPRYNPSCVVQLIYNRRSHRAILEFSNQAFYGGILQYAADPGVVNSMLNCEVLVNKQFPALFHAVTGKDEQEKDSPSYFNKIEATIVKQYVTAIRADKKRLTSSDIAIISPYSAQCKKIRELIRPIDPLIKVGSVEEFQGQERKVIIISTTRSNTNLITSDIRQAIGFLANAPRLNVAITRAQALLIVIGDPRVLSLDPTWRSFLSYLHRNRAWTGVQPHWDTSETVGNVSSRHPNSDDVVAVTSSIMSSLSLWDGGDAPVDHFRNVDDPFREDD